jgi:hypothetical protein
MVLKVTQGPMRSFIPLILIAAAGAACDAPAQHQAEAANPTQAASISVPNGGGLIPGTPEGDLADWVGDIREGIAEVSRLAATDVAAAQKKALDLYVTRQEYSEMYYGVDGRNKATAELSAAIETAEEHFHVVMKVLANPNPELAQLESAVGALDAQQALVAKLWKQSGVTLQRTAS